MRELFITHSPSVFGRADKNKDVMKRLCWSLGPGSTNLSETNLTIFIRFHLIDIISLLLKMLKINIL